MQQHPLEARYGLTAAELLDAMDRRFRARVTLEGAVAEVHMERIIRQLVGTVIEDWERHDQDGHPDFSLWLPGAQSALLAECKNVRDAEEGYRTEGQVVAYKVETQKTRTSRGDPSSRFYGVDQFHLLGVCLGKKTGCWSDFVFASTRALARHPQYPEKLATMQKVPLPGADDLGPWYTTLGELLRNWR